MHGGRRYAILCDGDRKKRGQVPRFVVVRTASLNDRKPHGEAAPLGEVFEHIVAAMTLDPAFAGIEFVQATARKLGSSFELSLLVDRDGPVDLLTVERVAAHVNAALVDRPERFDLTVASAGLERPLVRPADYERFRDRNVRIVTTLAVEQRKTHRGRLLGLRENAAVLDVDNSGRELPLPLDVIKTANLEYDPRADLTRAKREKKHGDKNKDR